MYGKLLALFLALTVCGADHVSAADRKLPVKVIGSGNDVEFDSRTIPADMQKGYLAMKMFCLECHGQERMITTLKTGVSPVTKLPYKEAEFKDKIVKIMRSPKSNLDAGNAKILTDFFHYLIRNGIVS